MASKFLPHTALVGGLLLAGSGVAWARASTVLDLLRSSAVRMSFMPRYAFPGTMSNVDEELAFSDPSRLYPLRGEEGHWTAVRFTPKFGGFEVEHVRFYAPNVDSGGINCAVDIDRLVELYVVDELVPPAQPQPVASYVVPGLATNQVGSLQIDVDLADSVWVAPGQTLFVAIEMPGDYPSHVACLVDGPGDPDADETEFWSNAADAPYAGQGLDTFGIPTKPIVSVTGKFVH